MNTTRLISKFFIPRQQEIKRYALEAESMQTGVLSRLLRQGSATEWGKQHGYTPDLSYAEFASQCPVTTYDDLKS